MEDLAELGDGLTIDRFNVFLALAQSFFYEKTSHLNTWTREMWFTGD